MEVEEDEGEDHEAIGLVHTPLETVAEQPAREEEVFTKREESHAGGDDQR